MAKKKGGKKQKKIKIELAPLSFFLWSIFLLFLLAWVFVLGILTGRGFLPGAISDIEGPLKTIRKTISRAEDNENKKAKEDPAFNFYDNLENKKNEVKKKRLPSREKKPSQEITLSRDESVSESGRSTGENRNIESQNKSLPENIKQDAFSVQIASLSNVERAEELIKELVDQGYDAYYYGTTVNGKKTYRIMCGRFERRSEAVVCLNKLKKYTGYKGFIVKFGK